MHHPICIGVIAQHVEGLSTQERHAGDVGMGAAEVGVQVGAHPDQRLGHCASGGGATVRFTPLAGSNTASCDVSKANSNFLPFAAFDAAGTRATNSCSTGPVSSSSSDSCSECTTGPSAVK